MQTQPSNEMLVPFLITAKQRTYASGGSDSSTAVKPLIPGSHQLEYSAGGLLYRDIYFGEAHFAGQEVVFSSGVPVWSMCYAGGWTAVLAPAEIDELAGLLQSALRQVPPEIPFRGPLYLSAPPYEYRNQLTGDLSRFEGTETMFRAGQVLYRLVYTGGRLD